MANFNRVILVGNVTRDPQIRYTSSGLAVCEIGLAVNDRRKGANGEWIDEPTFVDVTLWERTAETASEYLSKGSSVLIEGRLKLDSWQDKDGQKRSKLRVVGEKMQMLGGRGAAAGGPGGPGSDGPPPNRGPRRESRYNEPAAQSGPSRDDYDAPPADGPSGDDIPF